MARTRRKPKRKATRTKALARRKPPKKKRLRKKRARQALKPVKKDVLVSGIYGGDPTSGQIATPPTGS